MMILCWNVRGLNKTGKLRAIREITHQKDYAIICLLEHKIKRDLPQTICRHWEGMEVSDNLSFDPMGRILLLWNPQVVKLDKISESSKFMHFAVSYSITQTPTPRLCMVLMILALDVRSEMTSPTCNLLNLGSLRVTSTAFGEILKSLVHPP